MTKQQNIARRALASTVVGALAIAACSPNDGPLAARPQLLTSRLALSSGAVAAGGRVAVDVRIEGASEDLGALQGMVRFDAAKLRYVGQQQNGTILYVNRSKASQGELHIAEVDVDGLAPRKSALVFEVVAPQYVGSIRYEHEVAAGKRTLAQFTRVENGGVMLDEALSVASGAHTMDYAEWKAELARQDAARGKKGSVALRPGEYLLNLKYGDPTLDGVVNLTDGLYDINVAVGLSEIITGTDAAAPNARDAVVAGNVAPYNVGSSTLFPGDEPDGSRVVNVTDALGIINQAVLANQPVVGTLIPGRGPVATNVVAVVADITTNTTWTKNNIYNLKARINVLNGATLTIQAGTRIEGDGAACTPGSGGGGTCTNLSGTALLINRDGMIDAQGTALEPIVFTCSAAVKSKGCWGGLWLAGNAPVNSFGTTSVPLTPTNPANGSRSVAGCLQALGEAGAPLYGGCNPDDNSGILRYVRVEFGGLVTSVANVELNNLTLGGVGRGTTIDHVQVFGGSDDGIELFGGSVDMKYMVIQENGDDQLDFAEGYIGRTQFIITAEDPQDGDKGFEIDNTPGGAFGFSTSAPWGTYAEVWNATILGRISTDPNGASSTNSVNAGIHVRRGFKGSIRNVLMYGFRQFVTLDNIETCQTDVNNAGRDSLVIRNGYFVNATTAAMSSNIAAATACQGAVPATTFLTDAGTSAGTNTLDLTVAGDPFYPSSAGRLNQAMERTNPDYRPRNGTSTTLAANPVSRNLTVTAVGGTGPNASLARAEFFDNTAKYFGAVAPASASKSDIPWYSGWTRTSNYP